MNDIDSAALKVATTWYQNKIIKDKITYDDINLGSLVEWELFHYLIQTIKNYYILEKILEKEKPHKVIIFGDIGPVEVILDRQNISYELTKQKNIQPGFIMDYIVIKYDIFNHPISFKISLQKFFWIKKHYEKILHIFLKMLLYKIRKGVEKSYLFLEFNPSTYKDLLFAAKKQNCNIKLLNFRKPAVWNLDSFRIVMKSNCEIVHLGDERLTEYENAILDNIKKFSNMEEIFTHIFVIKDKSFWFFIEKDFTNFCTNRFREIFKEIRLISTLLKKDKIDCMLGWNDSLQTEKTIMTIGKKMGIPTAVLQHGLFAHNDELEKIRSHIRINGIIPLIADYLCSWGKIMNEYAIKCGMKKDNIIMVGSPRHDNFFEKNKPPLKHNKTILFATSGLGNNSVATFTSEILEKYEKSIESICLISQKLEGYDLVVKLHPYSSDFIDIKNIVKKNNPNAKIIQNANMSDLIENCDVLITYGQSTVLLESMILKKPTISIWLYDFIRPEDDAIFRYDAITISKFNDLEKNLERILTDKNYAEMKIMNGKRLVDDYLSNHGKSSQELLEFLNSVTNK